jgi:Uma2 family endonuclease
MKKSVPVQAKKHSKLLKVLVDQTRIIMDNRSELRKSFHENYKPGDRLEFINGAVIPQSPKLKHSIPLKNLLNILRTHIQNTKEGLVKEDALVTLTENDLMPDISYYKKDKAATIPLDGLHFPPPDFVVEVLASTSDIIDKEIKLNDYEKHGVQEYWIVSPFDEDVFHYLLNEQGKYQMVERFSEKLTSEVLGLEIPLNAIFDGGMNLSFIHEMTIED